ncbi:type II toxin-antitoxin system PemK/MazF family toxin [Streptomyces pathocidini]|uniref:type II toxin-antitoxin system PemK/MazF family toxin n=1 Tax=Streptomyces pathocidini TaxID=1650571 RepID=UPI0033CB8035
MDTSWWWVLGAIVVVAVIAALADGLRRRGRGPAGPGRERSAAGGPGRGGVRRPPGRRERPGRQEHGGEPGQLPQAGEIWWAEVPFEDGPGSKDRPCLVLALRGKTALVAKITSKFHEERDGVVPLPPGSVGDASGRASYLETEELREVPLKDFRRHVGAVDKKVWSRVRDLAH